MSKGLSVLLGIGAVGAIVAGVGGGIVIYGAIKAARAASAAKKA